MPLNKLEPFGPDEGMSFGRNSPAVRDERLRKTRASNRNMEPLDVDLEEGELELPERRHAPQHGAVASRDARDRAHRPRALGRDDREGRRADRVPAPRLREDVASAGRGPRSSRTSNRLNYVSPMLNNVGYALAVERCAASSCRTAASGTAWRSVELARISDHLTCTGAMAMELGAFTPFLWFIKAREMVVGHPRGGDPARASPTRSAASAAWPSPPTADFKDMCRSALPVILGLGRGGRGDAPQEPHLPRPPRERRDPQRQRRGSPSGGRARASAPREWPTTSARCTRT